jgi:hypothetical protein
VCGVAVVVVVVVVIFPKKKLLELVILGEMLLASRASLNRIQ